MRVRTGGLKTYPYPVLSAGWGSGSNGTAKSVKPQTSLMTAHSFHAEIALQINPVSSPLQIAPPLLPFSGLENMLHTRFDLAPEIRIPCSDDSIKARSRSMAKLSRARYTLEFNLEAVRTVKGGQADQQ
jgi:hypothetical protein